jgi:hypothetical protein
MSLAESEAVGAALDHKRRSPTTDCSQHDNPPAVFVDLAMPFRLALQLRILAHAESGGCGGPLTRNLPEGLERIPIIPTRQ